MNDGTKQTSKSMIKIIWQNKCPDDDLLDKTVKELQQFVDKGTKPSQLVTHTVYSKGGGYFGPSVLVYGSEGDDEYFHAEYNETTEYVDGDGNVITCDEELR